MNRLLKVIIAGDPKGAVDASDKTGGALDNLKAKFDKVKSSPTAFAATTTAAVIGIGKELYDVGATFDDAYDKIRVGTGATGDDLERLKGMFRDIVQDVPTDFGAASDAISLVGQKLTANVDLAKPLTEQFLELSRLTGTDLTGNIDAVAGAFNNWSVDTEIQGEKLDELFRASQNSGVGVAELASGLSGAGVQLRDLGFDFEQSTALIGTLGKAGIDVSDVMPALSKSMAKAAKDGKSAGDLFHETFDAIKGAPDDVAASGVALDVFGAKAGPKFAALIREGKLSFDDLQRSIEGGHDAILGAGKDIEDFSEKFQMFKNRALVAIEPVAMRVFDLLGKGMDFLSEHQPVLVALTAVVGVGLVTAFGAWAVAAFTAEGSMLPLIATVVAITAASAALVLGVLWLKDNWSEVWGAMRNTAGAAVDWIIDRFQGFLGFFASIPGRIGDALYYLPQVWFNAWKAALNSVIGLWNALDFGIHLDFELPSWIPGVGGKGFSFDVDDVIPDVPYLAQGGITTGGPLLALLGDNRSGTEAIVPLERADEFGFGGSSDRGGDNVIHVHFHGPVARDSESWVIGTIEKAVKSGVPLGPKTRKVFATG